MGYIDNIKKHKILIGKRVEFLEFYLPAAPELSTGNALHACGQVKQITL